MRPKLGVVTCAATFVAATLTLDGAWSQETWSQETCKAPAGPATIAKFTEPMTKRMGFLTLHRHDPCGKLYLEIPAAGGPDLLYQAYVASGAGVRDIRLDRGAFDDERRGRLVSFRRFGTKVLLIERNTQYLAPESALGAVGDAGLAFANSTVAAFDVKIQEGDRVLIDASDFFLRDDVGIPKYLKAGGQGTYVLAPKLSAIDTASADATDRSIEVESLLTFTSGDPPPDGGKDRLTGVVADRTSLLMRQHHSLIKLPDLRTSTYRPRTFDPRMGFFDVTFMDPFQPPGQAQRRSFIKRHALRKKVPSDAISEPESPIIYHIDPSVPASVRALVREAVLWWNSAFESAGFRNAIRVEDLPAGVDGLTAGINIILWTPRSTRGWSHGTSVVDPRTGEILKTVVRLDGMRMRADQLLFDGLTGPYVDQPDFAPRDEAVRQRLRALVAHEIGHTLGLRHQYVGSAQGNSSIMDYPFPNVSFDATGAPILRDVFPAALGAWDKRTIMYGYSQVEPAQEAQRLSQIIEETEQAGLNWMTDEDMLGAAHPLVHKWDSGADPIADLQRVLALRRAALQRFSRTVIAHDEPLGMLQDALVPVYLIHQFQVKAVASLLGGFTYRHAARHQDGPVPVPASQQRAALEALLATLDPETLDPGERILALMAPRPIGRNATPESFSGATGVIFDALRPVADAATITVNEVFMPARAARLAQASTRDPALPGLDEVLYALIARTWKAPPLSGFRGAAQREIAKTVVLSMLGAIARRDSPAEVRGSCWAALDELQDWMRAHPASPDWKATYAFVAHTIATFQQDPAKFAPPAPVLPPFDPLVGEDAP